MATEIDDIDDGFEQALADRRHKELLSVLKGLANAMPKIPENKSDEEVKRAIDNQTEVIKGFVNVLKTLKQEKSDVNVERNDNKVVNSVDIMAKSILGGLVDLKKSIDIPEVPKEYEFTIIRNRWSDLIDKVVAKQIK